MYQTVNFNMFHDAFKAVRPDNFSYEGLKALFEYLEQYEEGTDSSIELDVIALCCEFSEVNLGEEDFKRYLEGGDLEDFLIAVLPSSVLVGGGW